MAADVGQPIELAEGRSFNAADLSLLATGAIDGHIVDDLNEPVGNLLIQAARSEFVAGATRLMPTMMLSAVTDDKGYFRIFGVASGDYYLEALSGPFARGKISGFALAYYPGVIAARDASSVHVAPGRTTPDTDFVVAMADVGTLSGKVIDRDDMGVGSASLTLLPLSGGDVRSVVIAQIETDAQGNFVIPDIPTGQYLLQAAARNKEGGGYVGFATLAVDVALTAQNTVLALKPGSVARGRFAFEAPAPPPAPRDIAIYSRPTTVTTSPAYMAGQPPLRIGDDGTFELGGNFGLAAMAAAVPPPHGI